MLKETIKNDWRSRTFYGWKPWTNPVQLNDLDAFVPEMWAAEAVDLMYENWVWPGLVKRDFEDSLQEFGDTVNTRKKTVIDGNRKQHDLRAKTVQDAKATNIPVTLNQWIYTSIILGDREQSLSFQDLANNYLPDLVAGKMRVLDRSIAAQSLRFRANAVGGMGTMSSSNAKSRIIEARRKMNNNNVPEVGRWMGWTNASESKIQEVDLFKSLEYNGNLDGAALRAAQIGPLYGFNNFRSPNLPSVDAGDVTLAGSSGTVDGAVSAGSTTLDVHSGEGSNFAAGQYIKVDGDDTPLRIKSISTDTLTLEHATLNAIANDAAIDLVANAAINQSSAISKSALNDAVSDGYPAGWTESIVYDGTGAPNVGQIVAFTTSGGSVLSAEYVIVQVSGDEILLDRPLEDDVDDNAAINLGPSGDINFGFNSDAIAVVNRPLALPPQGTGVVASRYEAYDISCRVKISYDDSQEGIVVTLASLFGLEVLDTERGVVVWG